MRRMIPPELRELVDGGFRILPFQKDFHCELRALDAISTARFRGADIAELAWYVEGKPDGAPWIAIFRIADGRWVYFSYTLQITGDIYFTYVFSTDRGRLWWWACTDDDRDRLSTKFSDDDHADEMVQLDIMLQSDDDQLRRMGEWRMSRKRRR